MEILRTTELTKVFHQGDEEIYAVDHVNLTVEEGAFLVVTGRSGSGKTTLLNILACIDKPDSGSVVIDGEDVSALSSAKLSVIRRRKLGYIFQDFNLLNILTAEENIKMPAFLDGKNPDRERFTQLVTELGIADRLKHLPNELSGGQKQRVAIARALAMDPEVLLCDEATSALDPNTTRSILSLLQEINRTMGVTIVVITHEMKVVEQICNKVAVLDGGVVAESGLVKDIFVSPQSAIARELILPKQSAVSEIHGNCVIRVVFDGQSAFEPVISNLSLECRAAVNILGADTKNIDGRAYGQMLLQLPDDEAAVARIRKYLESRKIVYEDIEYTENREEAEDHA